MYSLLLTLLFLHAARASTAASASHWGTSEKCYDDPINWSGHLYGEDGSVLANATCSDLQLASDCGQWESEDGTKDTDACCACGGGNTISVANGIYYRPPAGCECIALGNITAVCGKWSSRINTRPMCYVSGSCFGKKESKKFEGEHWAFCLQGERSYAPLLGDGSCPPGHEALTDPTEIAEKGAGNCGLIDYSNTPDWVSAGRDFDGCDGGGTAQHTITVAGMDPIAEFSFDREFYKMDGVLVRGHSFYVAPNSNWVIMWCESPGKQRWQMGLLTSWGDMEGADCNVDKPSHDFALQFVPWYSDADSQWQRYKTGNQTSIEYNPNATTTCDAKGSVHTAIPHTLLYDWKRENPMWATLQSDEGFCAYKCRDKRKKKCKPRGYYRHHINKKWEDDWNYFVGQGKRGKGYTEKELIEHCYRDALNYGGFYVWKHNWGSEMPRAFSVNRKTGQCYIHPNRYTMLMKYSHECCYETDQDKMAGYTWAGNDDGDRIAYHDACPEDRWWASSSCWDYASKGGKQKKYPAEPITTVTGKKKWSCYTIDFSNYRTNGAPGRMTTVTRVILAFLTCCALVIATLSC